MRRAASSTIQDNGSYAKGMKILVEIWIKYKPRLPSKLYQERILQTADILFEMKALEYLLWASISLELSIPLMTAKYLPWLVTLYCAVCHCYYDNQATVQAELSAMMFKRAVFETRKRSKPLFRVKPKSTLREIHTIVPWPHTATERMLMGLFDSSAAHFFGIIEALWDSTRHPLQTTMPDEPELQEVVLELLSAGISILSGVATSSEQKCNRQPCISLSAVTSTSSLIDLAIAGENKVPIMSTVRFIKLLFQYKQPEAFTELAREMLQVLSGLEGQSFRKAERELALLCSFNTLLSSQKSHPKDGSVIDDRHKHLFSMSDEFSGLIETLHKSVCGSASDVQPDGDLVLDVVLFLWGKVKVLMQKENPEFIHYAEKIDHYKWLWCLSVLCDVAFACDLVSVDCTMMAEMIIMMTNLLENTAKNCEHRCQVAESELLDRIKKNKVSKALFLCQKALLVYNKMEPNNSSITKRLMEEASSLIEKAEVEERKLYFSTIPKAVAENKDKGMKEEDENPPPPPILLSRTDRSLTFVPAPYTLEAHVCWYQLCGRAAVGINQKVRLGDCSLPGTGHMVPVISGECVLKVEGLLPNQKYVFAVAAYNSRGKLLGNTIGSATFPLLASMPVPLLSAWAHLAQLFLTSIFTETEINIQMGSLYCDSFGDNGLFIWEQEARLAECERILLAMDLALWLNDGIAAVQAVVICYGLLAPLIFHQVTCKPMALRVLRENQMASVVMDCGRKLLQEVHDAQLQNKSTPPYDDTRRKVRQKIPHSMLQTMRTNRQMQAVENLITMLSSVVHRHKKQFQLRMMCCEERVWKAHLNYLMAQAHIALLYQGLDKLRGGALQYRYSEMNPLCFSLAYSGILVWRKSQRLESAKHEVVSERDSSNSGLREYIAAFENGSKNDVGKVDDTTDESYDEGEDFTQPVEQQTEMHKRTATLLLDSLNKAALHLRRAMVLAHRGSHWTILQCVCQTVWDHSCRISFLVQSAAHLEPPSVITAEQLHTTITPLLVMATDLILDMFNRLRVTYKSYAFCQLLSGWTRHPAPQPPIRKRATQGSATPRDAIELKGFVTHLPHYQSRSFSRSTSLVDFNPIVIPALDQLYDLTAEDFSTIYALYSFPISPDHMPTVIAAYSTSIKHLQAHCNDSLRVLALHEMGNIQFYNGNMRLAQSHWSKAVDCALQSSGTIEKWDGMSFGGGSLQQTLKQAGIWGCLQAAGLTAKIAHHQSSNLLNSNPNTCAGISKKTCVLCCSLAQPQADLQYASHSIRDELLPGVDLFSEPHRVQLDTTVTSLNFVCHWLYTTGYHITLLPILALYLHFVGPVCRDVQRTVEGKILKIRALTELCLFTEAVKEAVQLAQGLGVLLPYGHYITKDNIQPMKMFYSNKSLIDNAEALEELLNIDIAPEICALYGSTLCLRFHLARIQLVLALSNTVHGSPAPDCQEFCVNKTSSVNSEQLKQDMLDTEGPSFKTDDHKVLDLVKEKGKLNPERIKFHLLERASSMLRSVAQHLVSQCCTKMENLELEIESNLLKANLYFQQGHAVLSSEMAVSTLVLLQTSPVITKRSRSGSHKLLSELPHPTARSKQDPPKDCSTSNPLKGDCPREVEVSERIGVSLWLRCRLSLVRSLSLHIRTPASLFLGNNVIEEAARVIKEGLNECAQWGDLEIQALLMVEGAELEAHRGKTDDSMAMLQKNV
ncbi:Cilia- and flagella-associated protein 54 [Channa argus]|uniref:Cilia-and flagella-associated protein 54 n=1 Tax=Channa argus TaxID=215402 RepID=A0A6G1QUX8_CHAAH|nr:Cilia- and flagella-associated protein 54 [Channa argus]